MITIRRELTAKLDGWTATIDGRDFHDCYLGGLVCYLADLGFLKVGDAYKVVNGINGQEKVRTYDIEHYNTT